jgi:hypothetical protein
MKERIMTAEPGDYIVARQGKIYSVLIIRNVSPEKLTLEEISISEAYIRNISSWRGWVEKKAPNASSWSVFTIDIKKEKLLGGYSFSKKMPLNVGEDFSFFPRLLHLSLKKLFSQDRKKIGPPPKEGEPDHRKLWVPSVFIEGKKIDSPQTDVFQSTWPQDGTELAGKIFDFYFPKNFSLPCWMQVTNGHLSIILQVVDSGKNLLSPQKTLPLLFGEFTSSAKLKKEGLFLELKAPEHIQDFRVFAIDITHPNRIMHPLFCSTRKNQETFNIFVSNEPLKLNLKKGHQYLFLAVPVGYQETPIETKEPFIFPGV